MAQRSTHVMSEKGKGLVTGKLRTTKLIEAVFQLRLRVLVGTRNDENQKKTGGFRNALMAQGEIIQ